MEAFNKNIRLDLFGNPDQKKQTFYAFKMEKGVNPDKYKNISVKRLKNLYDKYKLKYRKAEIKIKDRVVFRAIDGIEVSENDRYFGPDISKFKLKILLKNQERIPAIYSNVLLENINEEKAYYDLINRFVKGIYRKDMISALVYKIDANRNETLFAKWGER